MCVWVVTVGLMSLLLSVLQGRVRGRQWHMGGKKKWNEIFFLSVRELKEGCRLNRNVRTKQSSAWEMVLLAWIQRNPRESWQRSEEAGHDSSMGRRDEADMNYWRLMLKSDENSRGKTSFCQWSNSGQSWGGRGRRVLEGASAEAVLGWGLWGAAEAGGWSQAGRLAGVDLRGIHQIPVFALPVS